jgi:hypothetical protein
MLRRLLDRMFRRQQPPAGEFADALTVSRRLRALREVADATRLGEW